MKIDWEKSQIIDEPKGLKIPPDVVIEKLQDFITQDRKSKIEEVLKKRSAHFAPVMEGIYDRGNISAVMRSAEAFGFYNFHIIETSNEFKKSQRVTQGADKWLDVKKWKKTSGCISHLKSSGYQVYSTHLSKDAIPFDELDFSKKTAVVFGNEKDGVSDEALKLSDGNVLLPMSGFTQSFNISVAGALSFQRAYLHNLPKIGDAEAKMLRALYYFKTITWPDKALIEVFKQPR